jgi:uncharacterized membrane protein
MPGVCASCGTPLGVDEVTCSACGVAVQLPRPPIGRTGLFRDNVAGSLAYFTCLPAIIFILREPYKGNRFIRFHSWQSVWLTVTVIILAVLSFFALGHLIVLLACAIGFVGAVIVWMLLIVKALQGEMFKLPLIGSFAEHQANSNP